MTDLMTIQEHMDIWVTCTGTYGLHVLEHMGYMYWNIWVTCTGTYGLHVLEHMGYAYFFTQSAHNSMGKVVWPLPENGYLTKATRVELRDQFLSLYGSLTR